jgi:hypothetical protein
MGPPTLVPFPKLFFRRNLRAIRAATPIRAAPTKTAINADLTAIDIVDLVEFTSKSSSSDASGNDGLFDGIIDGGGDGDRMGVMTGIGLAVGIGLVVVGKLGVFGKLIESSYMDCSLPKSPRKSLELRRCQ